MAQIPQGSLMVRVDRKALAKLGNCLFVMEQRHKANGFIVVFCRPCHQRVVRFSVELSYVLLQPFVRRRLRFLVGGLVELLPSGLPSFGTHLVLLLEGHVRGAGFYIA